MNVKKGSYRAREGGYGDSQVASRQRGEPINKMFKITYQRLEGAVVAATR
jgi:hypothetical protein